MKTLTIDRGGSGSFNAKPILTAHAHTTARVAVVHMHTWHNRHPPGHSRVDVHLD